MDTRDSPSSIFWWTPQREGGAQNAQGYVLRGNSHACFACVIEIASRIIHKGHTSRHAPHWFDPELQREATQNLESTG